MFNKTKNKTKTPFDPELGGKTAHAGFAVQDSCNVLVNMRVAQGLNLPQLSEVNAKNPVKLKNSSFYCNILLISIISLGHIYTVS